MFTRSRHRLPLIAARSWDNDLLDARRYREVFETLRQRAASQPSLLRPSSRPGSIGLAWLLAREDLATRRMLQALASPGFALGTQRKVRVVAGKARDIYVADWPDRIILMVMGRILGERIQPVITDRVFSFRKGRSHWDALRQLRTFLRDVPAHRPVHVVRRDVREFGDSIDQERCLRQLAERTALPPRSRFAKVLTQAIRPVFACDGASATLWRGIPSGSPLCPPLENLYLDELDRRLCALPGTFHARYGDDLLVATEDDDVARDAAATIADTIAALGLTVSPEKALDVTLASPEQGVEWLGFRMSRAGRLGCKRERWREARRRLSAGIDRFVATAFAADLDDGQRLALLRAGVGQLLEPGGNPWLQGMVFEQDDPRPLRDLDRHLARHLAETLGRHLGGGRHRGWQVFRKLGYRSLVRLRAERRWL